MKKIPIYGIKASNRFALIDDSQYDALVTMRWNIDADGYAVRSRNNKLGYDRVKMHRLIIGAQSGQIVDHINNNKLDNRRENLRFVTKAQNAWNYRGYKLGASGLRGVRKRRNKWEAFLSVNNRTKYLGLFDTPELAAKARESVVEKVRKFD